MVYEILYKINFRDIYKLKKNDNMFKNIYLKIKKHRIIRKEGLIGYAKYLGITIGKDCRIYTSKFGTEPFLIEIGNKVTITEGVKILTHDGATWLLNDEKGRRYLYRKVKIGNNVFIGVNSILLPGVIVEDNVIIAAGSVVTKSIPKNSIVAGNPAKKIGDFEKYKNKGLVEFISDVELDNNGDYKEKVINSIDTSFKDYM